MFSKIKGLVNKLFGSGDEDEIYEDEETQYIRLPNGKIMAIKEILYADNGKLVVKDVYGNIKVIETGEVIK